MDKKRPVNLNLTKFKFPRMAIVSISHRISGVVIFLSLPIFIYLLGCSLSSPVHYAEVLQWLHNPILKLIIWASLTALFFHFVAGIRHLIMDFGFAESLSASRFTATVVLALGVIGAILLGVWVW